jgi:hypothetical protein
MTNNASWGLVRSRAAVTGRVIDLTEIVGRQLNGRSSDVLLEPVQRCGARDWDNPRLLGQQPRVAAHRRDCTHPPAGVRGFAR